MNVGKSGKLGMRAAPELAPFLRWLLGDIFDTVREHHPAERMVIFIDERLASAACSKALSRDF